MLSTAAVPAVPAGLAGLAGVRPWAARRSPSGLCPSMLRCGVLGEWRAMCYLCSLLAFGCRDSLLLPLPRALACN